MSTLDSFEEIVRAALSLPLDERAMIADRLLVSLVGLSQDEIDASWAGEVERRIREIDEGTVETIDGEMVMQKLRSRYKSL